MMITRRLAVICLMIFGLSLGKSLTQPIGERNMLLADEGAPKLMGYPLFLHAMAITLLPQVSGGWKASYRGLKLENILFLLPWLKNY